jgi:hypothetical protein
LEVALDRLATVARAGALDPARAAAPILERRDRLSSVALVLSAWDESRRALVRALELEAMAVLVVVVGDELDAVSASGAGASPVVISAKRVLAGEAIAL